jgi:prepilin-type N-terminal cleavage/methylation domain-containing protein
VLDLLPQTVFVLVVNMLFLSSKPKPSEAGFTILEVLVVVIIVGILAAIAAPSWLAYATRQRVRAVETDLVQVLKLAQQDAISRRTQVTVEIIENPDGLPIASTDGFEERLGPNELQEGMIALDASAPLAAVPEDVDSVTFDYQGMVRLGAAGTAQALPFVVKINPANNDNIQACVVVTTVLGGVMSFEDATCDNDAVAWQDVL